MEEKIKAHIKKQMDERRFQFVKRIDIISEFGSDAIETIESMIKSKILLKHRGINGYLYSLNPNKK